MNNRDITDPVIPAPLGARIPDTVKVSTGPRCESCGEPDLYMYSDKEGKRQGKAGSFIRCGHCGTEMPTETPAQQSEREQRERMEPIVKQHIANGVTGIDELFVCCARSLRGVFNSQTLRAIILENTKL